MKSFMNCPLQCDQMKEGTKDGTRSKRVRQGDNLQDLGVEVWIMLLTLKRLMSYIYGAPILDVSRSHTTTQHSR